MAKPEAVTEVLIQAYRLACLPTPFHPERGDPQMATLVRGRMNNVGFAPYWGDMFVELRDNYNGNRGGFFAQNVLRAAETQEGPELLATVAQELSRNFGQYVLRAEFEIPLLEEPQRSSPLARFLIKRRAELTGFTILLYPGSPMISSAWIRLAHRLAFTDAVKHGQLLTEISQGDNRAYHDGTQAKAEDSWMGGFDDFDRDHLVIAALAGTLAQHFPKIVVSQLREPARVSP